MCSDFISTSQSLVSPLRGAEVSINLQRDACVRYQPGPLWASAPLTTHTRPVRSFSLISAATAFSKPVQSSVMTSNWAPTHRVEHEPTMGGHVRAVEGYWWGSRPLMWAVTPPQILLLRLNPLWGSGKRPRPHYDISGPTLTPRPPPTVWWNECTSALL